jgi:hypothetical protein
LIPTIIKRRWNLVLPLPLGLAITIAIFLHVGGGVLGMYGLIPRYDKFAHFFTSALIAFFAITVIYLLDKYTTALKMDLLGIIFVSIITTMAFGVCWEIGEFTVDQLFGTHEQGGLYDTMTDLIYDTIAGIVVGLVCGTLIKRGTFEERIHSLDESAKMLAIKHKKGKVSVVRHHGSK